MKASSEARETIEDVEVFEPDVDESGVQVFDGESTAGSGGSLGAWSPSPLALLSDDEFEKRLVVLKDEQRRIAKVKQALLVLDRDYGLIPGTQTPSLFQPGAEAYNRLAHLRPRYIVKRETGDGEAAPPVRFQVECELLDADGRIHGTGFGSASFWEKKFRYRNSLLECPECGGEFVFKSKNDPGWFCWKTKGGCGAQFGPKDQRIATQKPGLKENEDPHDLDNTILQYACKRAYVKATRTTHALSNAFTQDVEDMDPADVQQHGTERTARAEKKQKRQDQAAKAVSEGQVAMLVQRSKEAAERTGDDSITYQVVLADVLKKLGIERIEAVPQSRLPEAVKAFATWAPGGAA